MRGWWALAVLTCLSAGAAMARATTGSAPDDPGFGVIVEDVYRNDYFGMRYKLPPHWRTSENGPSPSESGYYLLRSFVPRGELAAMILIAAQDLFFATSPSDDAAEMVRRFTQALHDAGTMTVDLGPTELMIGGHRFSRVEFSGAGLHHAMFVTALRCHLLSFNMSASEAKLLEDLTKSLDELAFARDDGAKTPICIKGYANAENLLHRVEPLTAVGSRFVPIPVRIIVGEDGVVLHAHVIRATPRQREAIETALAQWRFRPYRANGAALPVETGLLFSFQAAQETLH